MSWSGTLNDFKDGVSYTGALNSDTTPNFSILGGKYGFGAHSSGTTVATLNILTPDGTFVIAATALSAGTPYETVDLPPGTFQIVMGAAATTQSGFLVRIPYRAA